MDTEYLPRVSRKRRGSSKSRQPVGKKTLTESEHQRIMKEEMDAMYQKVYDQAKADLLASQLPICTICQESIDLPLKVCRTGDHHMCAKCVSNMFKNAKTSFDFDENNEHVCSITTQNVYICCPLCRTSYFNKDDIFDLNRNRDCLFLYSVLPAAEQSLKCDDCDFVGSGIDMAKHHLLCSKTKFECKFCHEMLPSDEMQVHLDHDCGRLPCRFCRESDVTYTADTLRQHNIVHANHRSLRQEIDIITSDISIHMYSTHGRALESDNVPINQQVLDNNLLFHHICRTYQSMNANVSLADTITNLSRETLSDFFLNRLRIPENNPIVPVEEANPNPSPFAPALNAFYSARE